MLNKLQHATPVSATATHATAAVASIAGVAGRVYYITDIAASSDKAGAIVLVKQGTTVLWQLQVATTAAGINAIAQSFQSPLPSDAGAAVSVEIDGTSACKANIAGFFL